MNAIVSGRSGRALIIEGDSLKSFDVDDPSKIVPRQKADLPYIFGDAADLRILENTSLESVKRELRNDRNFTCALDLALISLDAELPGEIRQEALVELDELLASDDTLEQVESVLYAEALPEAADLKGAFELCGTAKTSDSFLRRLEEYQPRISTVRHAWESMPMSRFGSAEYRNEFKAVAVREGLFRALVLNVLPRTAASRRAVLSPSIQKLQNHEQILRYWQSRTVPIINLRLSRYGESIFTTDRTEMKKRFDALLNARGKRMRGAELYRKRKSKLKRISKDRAQKEPYEAS
jgi:hypothetical protein